MIPGIAPQKRDDRTTRNAQHLYCARYDQGVFGVPRTRFLEAVAAEGIPMSGGYGISLHRQPMFLNKAFGPYTGYRLSRPDLDFGALSLPNVDRMCESEGLWLTQNVLLGTRSDMDDIVRAIEKVYDQRHALSGVVEAAGAST
jgi:hypothetical protein